LFCILFATSCTQLKSLLIDKVLLVLKLSQVPVSPGSRLISERCHWGTSRDRERPPPSTTCGSKSSSLCVQLILKLLQLDSIPVGSSDRVGGESSNFWWSGNGDRSPCPSSMKRLELDLCELLLEIDIVLQLQEIFLLLLQGSQSREGSRDKLGRSLGPSGMMSLELNLGELLLEVDIILELQQIGLLLFQGSQSREGSRDKLGRSLGPSGMLSLHLQCWVLLLPVNDIQQILKVGLLSRQVSNSGEVSRNPARSQLRRPLSPSCMLSLYLQSWVLLLLVNDVQQVLKIGLLGGKISNRCKSTRYKPLS
jgi:hypothetical protein